MYGGGGQPGILCADACFYTSYGCEAHVCMHTSSVLICQRELRGSGRSLTLWKTLSSWWSCENMMTKRERRREREREARYISGALTAFRCAATASFCCLWRPVMCHNWHFLTGTHRQDSHKLFASALYTTQMTSSHNHCVNVTFLIWSVWALRLYGALTLCNFSSKHLFEASQICCINNCIFCLASFFGYVSNRSWSTCMFASLLSFFHIFANGFPRLRHRMLISGVQ